MPDSGHKPTFSLAPLVSDYARDPDMAEIVEAFRSELPARMRALETAWAAGRRDDLRDLAHQLKGACAGYGYAPLSAAAAELEEALRRAEGSGAIPGSRIPEGAASPLTDLLTLCRRALAA